MRCKNCGNEYPFDSNYCPKCGAKNQNNEHSQNRQSGNKAVSNDTTDLVTGIIAIALFIILIVFIINKFFVGDGITGEWELKEGKFNVVYTDARIGDYNSKTFDKIKFTQDQYVFYSNGSVADSGSYEWIADDSQIQIHSDSKSGGFDYYAKLNIETDSGELHIGMGSTMAIFE